MGKSDRTLELTAIETTIIARTQTDISRENVVAVVGNGGKEMVPVYDNARTDHVQMDIFFQTTRHFTMTASMENVCTYVSF
jgi:hypothetical protein